MAVEDKPPADTETKDAGAAGDSPPDRAMAVEDEPPADTEAKDAGAAGDSPPNRAMAVEDEPSADTETKDACAAGGEQPAAGTTYSYPPVTLCHSGRFIRFTLYGIVFEVTAKYGHPIGDLGKGGFGSVCAAYDSKRGELVAIKRIANAFVSTVAAKRAIREVKLLKHMNHENIVALRDIIPPAQRNSFDDLYFSSEMMPTDMEQIIHSGQSLSNEHHQFILYQLLRGLKYMHSANVLHRDLKPSNLLLNKDCELKICDFGLARTIPEWDPSMTMDVGTRWYRAPEILLHNSAYTAAVDVWSAGCIFMELIDGKPLFPGIDEVHQLRLILELIGTPDEAVDLGFLDETGRSCLREFPRYARQSFTAKFPHLNHLAIDLVEKMLTFDPRQRITKLILVGKSQAALKTLNNHLISRNLIRQKNIEEIMMKYIELCVDLRKLRSAKDGLIVYKKLCQRQRVNVSSLEAVIKHFMRSIICNKLSNEKVEKSMNQANALGDAPDVQHLGAHNRPEDLMMLSYVGGQKGKDASEVCLKFLYETYRPLLDKLKNISTLETLYAMTAHKAFQSCWRYRRTTEFVRLCEAIRKHLTNLKRCPEQRGYLSAPKIYELNLDTRAEQLKIATKFSLWKEAFHSVLDIHGLMSFVKKIPKTSVFLDTESDEISNHLSVLADSLKKAKSLIHPPVENKPSKLGEKTITLAGVVETEHKRLLARKSIIEKRKDHEQQMLDKKTQFFVWLFGINFSIQESNNCSVLDAIDYIKAKNHSFFSDFFLVHNNRVVKPDALFRELSNENGSTIYISPRLRGGVLDFETKGIPFIEFLNLNGGNRTEWCSLLSAILGFNFQNYLIELTPWGIRLALLIFGLVERVHSEGLTLNGAFEVHNIFYFPAFDRLGFHFPRDAYHALTNLGYIKDTQKLLPMLMNLFQHIHLNGYVEYPVMLGHLLDYLANVDEMQLAQLSDPESDVALNKRFRSYVYNHPFTWTRTQMASMILDLDAHFKGLNPKEKRHLNHFLRPVLGFWSTEVLKSPGLRRTFYHRTASGGLKPYNETCTISLVDLGRCFIFHAIVAGQVTIEDAVGVLVKVAPKLLPDLIQDMAQFYLPDIHLLDRLHSVLNVNKYG